MTKIIAKVAPYRYYAIAVAAVLGISIYFFNSNNASARISTNPEFSRYISAFTAGTISREGTIRIQLSGAREDSTNNNTEELEDLFDFEPKIEGKVSWIDAYTLEFKSDKILPAGTNYQGTFHLGEMMEVADSFKEFYFTFQTITQSFEISEPMMEAIDPQSLTYQKLTGELITADVEEPAKVESILSASQNDKNLKIKWEHAADNRMHRFVIDSLIRKKKETTVTLKWDGKDAGVYMKGQREIKIPALGDFKVMQAVVMEGEEQYVSVRFSDPLLPNQNLEGLIRFTTTTDNLRFVIDKNEIRVYPNQRLTGVHTLEVSNGILNIANYKMPNDFRQQVSFSDMLPNVKMLGKGVIIPNTERLVLPFEAVSLKAVDVTIVRIYENNVDQFLQVNNLSESNELKRVGRPLIKKMIRLDNDAALDLRKTNRFALDLSKIIKTEPGAIYNVKFTFKKAYSVYRCDNDTMPASDLEQIKEEREENWDDNNEHEFSYWDYWDEYVYDDYNWQERDNPCSNSYFTSDKWVSRNVMASDLGIIAKRGTGEEIFFAVTDLKTTNTISGVTLEVYDYQKQLIGKGTTDNEGFARFNTSRKPYMLIAKNGSQRGYLRLDDGSSLSLSRFDVSGEVVQKGLKGFIYGERGVWRPGDSIYTMFVLDDHAAPIPKNHPVSFELYNPQGQLYKRLVKNASVNGFYSFHTATNPDAPTGSWSAKVKVGGATFSKNIRIETVQPNRLKINIDFGVPAIKKSEPLHAKLESKWLHGATASNLRATVEVSYSTATTAFPKFADYVFEDPSQRFYAENEKIFEGDLDENGVANITANLEVGDNAPGMLNANFVTKVFEPGGNFSVDRFSIPYHPFPAYLGLRLPKGDKERGMLLTDTNHTVNIVSLTPEGKYTLGNKKVKVELYKVEWKFWWDQTNENGNSSYSESNYRRAMQEDEITLVNGVGKWKLRMDYPEWGRYLLKVIDMEGGHSSGKIFYMDWPGWAGRPQREGGGDAAMLTLNTDKQKYRVGEDVKLSIPSGKEGRALVSIETGSKIVETHWLKLTQGQTNFTFKTTKAMLPNVFVHVTLVQPHAQTANDLPIRMYGVIPVSVEDPATVLQPQLKTPSYLRSEEPAQFTVSEATGKPMTYTLAVVDDGLLDLTRYKTPDPHGHFYSKEALGVKTWDLYDFVMGAYAVEMNRILAIGGDEGINMKEGNKKANRFKPVVQFLGPFHLDAKQSKTHTIKLPQYIGSVRVMVVAGENGAYGSTEKSLAVKKPLMVLATLPRVLGPGESVKLPVTVFATEKNIKDVKVQIQANELLQINGNTSKSIKFSKTGEEMVDFDLKVLSVLGVAKVKVVATSGNERAEFDIELDVRNPNPVVTDNVEGTADGGKTWSANYKPVGMSGTNTAVLEVSTIPPINLGKRLEYLIQYPYGCVEQTTSSVFPQLVLNKLFDLPKERERQIDKNIRIGIQRLKHFQHADGGLGYWPGMAETDDWSTSYAGHFMIEAQNVGYTLPVNFLTEWKKYQKNRAMNWTYSNDRSDLVQAYRLYTLALAQSPEMGAMNRLKEQKNLSAAAKWRLAAAYALTGQREVSEYLIKGLALTVPAYMEMGYTYGSNVRDEAMILETLTLLNHKQEAANVVTEIAKHLSSDQWYSTQTTAYSLIAIAKYSGVSGAARELNFTYMVGGKNASDQTVKGVITQIPVAVNGGSISVQNKGGQKLYTRVILRGQPEVGDNTDASNNLSFEVKYRNSSGNEINPSKLEQGTDFMAEVTITNPGSLGKYDNMALTQIFPSGWEIHNTRMDGTALPRTASTPTYLDIRDDRVNTFFNINPTQKQTYYVLLNASYIGRYYLPTVYCEAMYNGKINARKGGMWVEVVPRKGKGMVSR